MEKVTAIILAVFMAVCGVSGAASDMEAPAASEASVSEAHEPADAMEFVHNMGIGINLGNTYEACGDWIAQWGSGTPEAYETAWGSPVITEKMIKGYAKAGFKTLRVPVAWSNMIGDDYTVSAEYIAAVKEVVDWAVKCDMYVIINLHYDNGWFENFPTDKKSCMYRYERIWTQIADAFGDYDEHLIFEGQNEELGWSSLWNQWSGSDKGKAESYALVNEINQKFVDIVRSSDKKNNKKTYLLIPGYNTGIETTVDKLYKVPHDPAERVIISVHYYSPATFAILTEDADWGKNQRTWGTAKDIKELEASMDMLKKRFLDKGIPVIIGEYGCPTENKDMDSVRLFVYSVCDAAYSRGMCPVLWSTPGHFYDRDKCCIIDKEMEENFKKIIKENK